MLTDPIEQADVYESGGLVVYRASALGGCRRRLALARQGFEPLPPPKQTQKLFEAGHEAERQLWRKGILEGMAQRTVTLDISKTIVIVGHLDAWTGEGHEAKSQVQAEFDKPIQESAHWYRWRVQISVYMHATRKRLRMVRALRDEEGNVSNIKEEWFDEPPVSLPDIRRIVFDVESLARKDLSDMPCDRTEFPCPFFYTHTDRAGVREYVDDDSARILAAEYQTAKTAANVAKAKVTAARTTLLEWMGERRRVELPEGWRVTRYKVEGRHVEYDSAGYEGVRVTPPKGDDDE